MAADAVYLRTQVLANLSYLFPGSSPILLSVTNLTAPGANCLVAVSSTTGALLLEFSSRNLNEALFNTEQLLSPHLAELRAGRGVGTGPGVEGLKAEIEGIKKEREGMRAEVEALKVEVEAIKQERDGMRAERDGWKNEVEGWKREVEGWRRENEGLRREIESGEKAGQKTPMLYDPDESGAAWSEDDVVTPAFTGAEEGGEEGCAPWMEVRDIDI